MVVLLDMVMRQVDWHHGLQIRSHKKTRLYGINSGSQSCVLPLANATKLGSHTYMLLHRITSLGSRQVISVLLSG